MGDLHERIRKAFAGRENQGIIRRSQDEIQRNQGAKKDSSEERRMQELQEARILLEGTNARELLEYVRREVWKEGGIQAEELGRYENTVTLTLESRHRRTSFEESRMGGEGGGGDSHSVSVKGVKRDRLSFKAGALGGDMTIQVKDVREFMEENGSSWKSWSKEKGEYVHLQAGNYSKAKEDLEQIIAGVCEARIMNRNLPRD